MVEQPISHARFVNVAAFWVIDVKTFVAAVAVGAVDECLVQFYNMIHEVAAEANHISFIFLADDEFFPGQTEIFYGDNFTVRMTQLFSSSSHRSPPPNGQIGDVELPIITVLKECYLLWHNFFVYLPRLMRYSLGLKVDELFINILEIALTAQYTRREEKKIFLQKLSQKMDTLKFFVTLLWEAKGLDANKYAQLSQKLATAGRMLGKWLQSIPDQQH